MPILVYIDNDISFKYNENWIKKYNSNDPFSIFAMYNNLSEKTFRYTKIPINYKMEKIIQLLIMRYILNGIL